METQESIPQPSESKYDVIYRDPLNTGFRIAGEPAQVLDLAFDVAERLEAGKYPPHERERIANSLQEGQEVTLNPVKLSLEKPGGKFDKPHLFLRLGASFVDNQQFKDHFAEVVSERLKQDTESSE